MHRAAAANDEMCGQSSLFYSCMFSSALHDADGSGCRADACTAAKCVVSPTGTFATANCDKSCKAPPKYACDGAQCVANATGSFTTATCDQTCIPPPPPKPTLGCEAALKKACPKSSPPDRASCLMYCSMHNAELKAAGCSEVHSHPQRLLILPE